jgi:hypothetical protein
MSYKIAISFFYIIKKKIKLKNMSSNWINSTNAKEIGTLYLIFAVFAGILIMLALNLAICWKKSLVIKYLIENSDYLIILFLVIIFITIEKPAVYNKLRDFTQEYLYKYF